jgi:3-phenylpropionate/trans-cinnamate dioxygenase ferredoxin component
MARRFVRMARAADIPEGEIRAFESSGTGVLICRVEGQLYALEDVCTHDDGPLGDGFLEGHEIECPRHGARFDVRTGAVCRMPAAAPVTSLPLKVEEGEVFVEIDPE